MVKLDVTDEQTVIDALQFIVEREGGLHVIVNNAGLGLIGPVESITDEEARVIFDTNLFGILKVCRNAIPHLRDHGGGYIINITSIAGLMGLPFRGIYAASKFAVEGFTESLSQEVAQFNIKVCIVEPGDFKTNINANRKVVKFVHPAYGEQNTNIQTKVWREVEQAPMPEAVGHCIARILRNPRPRLRYKVATPTQKFSVFLKRILPDRWFEHLIMRFYNINRK
jgi:hypothetical protein